jgi:hypothetical protein
MSSEESTSSKQDEEPLKVDPLIMIGLGVGFALILVGAATLIMGSPADGGNGDPLTATVTMDETETSVSVRASGTFPHNELYILKNGEQIGTMDISGSEASETHHVRNIEAGDQIQVTTYVNGEISVVNQHEVSEELGSRVNASAATVSPRSSSPGHPKTSVSIGVISGFHSMQFPPFV